MLPPTSLKLGKRSKLVFAPPSARCNASRSAGEGAKARRNRESLVDVDDMSDDPSPVGFKLSKDGSDA